MTHGYIDADVATIGRPQPGSIKPVPLTQKPPHILLVHDESNFDIRALPGVKVPPGYGAHFPILRLARRARRICIVEGIGGPSWYTEYNVLAGLAARSYGRFSYYVTQIASGRIDRGLPLSLVRCGYQTFAVFPALGAFMSARSFQRSIGMQHFYRPGDAGHHRRSSLTASIMTPRSRRSSASARAGLYFSTSISRRITIRGTIAGVPIWRRNGATSATIRLSTSICAASL